MKLTTGVNNAIIIIKEDNVAVPKSISSLQELEADLAASYSKKNLLRVSKVAEVLDVSRQMVYRYIDQGHLKAFRLPSGGLRVRASDMQRFIILLQSYKKFS